MGVPSFGLTGGTVANNSSLAAGDFDGYGSTEFITRFSYDDCVATENKIVYLNEAGRNYIDKTGFTVFYGRDSWDLDNSFTGTWSTGGRTRMILASVTSTTASYRPYINVSYTLPEEGSAPVSSFTSDRLLVRIPNSLTLTNTSTNTPTLWNWSWGDGTWTNGTTENPSHQYSKRGLFTTYLISSNEFGTDTSDTQTVRVVGYANE